jgi:FkbM family methyltransferase
MEMVPTPTTLTLAPHLRLVQARHGHFFVMSNDTYVGRSLIAYGQWTENEIDVIRRFLQPNHNVIDVGANIGSHTIPLAKTVSKGGQVSAFEVQPRIFQLLAANVTINGLTNVRLFAAGCSDQPGTMRFPSLDYDADNNYGGLKISAIEALAAAASERQPLRGTQPVPLLRLDDAYDLDRLALIKIDVEGMELAVLRGAERIVRRLRPVLYVENEFADLSEALLRYLSDLDYDVYWHPAPLFDPRNFRGNAKNLFPNIVCINVLCIPREQKRSIKGLKPVTDPAEHPRRKS